MTAKRVVLHIGTEKTGTTTIQEFLDSNRKPLGEAGFVTPNFMGRPSQRWLPVLCYDLERVDDFIKAVGLIDRAERERVIGAKREEFLRWADRQENGEIWLSSEHLSSRLTHDTEVSRLASLVRNIADEVIVLVYLREPSAAALSHLSTSILTGGTDLALPEPSRTSIYWDYRSLLERWGRHFGDDIRVRLFDQREFFRGHLVTDFLQSLGVDWHDSWVLPARSNSSASWPALRLLSLLNEKYPRFLADGSPNAARGRLASYLRTFDPDGPKRVLSRSEYRAYSEYFQESNAWVQAHFFPERTKLWSTPELVPDGDAEQSSGFTAAEVEVVSLIDRIWRDRAALSSGDIDVIRDAALYFEEGPGDLQAALALMQIAQRLRPDGPLISAKVESYGTALQSDSLVERFGGPGRD